MTNVYVIYSAMALPDLKDLLHSCGGFNAVKIIYGHSKIKNEKYETRRTIVVCNKKTIDRLRTKPDFANKVTDYDWSAFYLPDDKKKETWDLHVSGFPITYTTKDAEKFIRRSIGNIVPDKVAAASSAEGAGEVSTVVTVAAATALPVVSSVTPGGGSAKQELVDSYTIHFPCCRETGMIRGYGSIRFHDNITDLQIQVCKLLLHNSRIMIEKGVFEDRMIYCTWHSVATSRDLKGRDKPHNKKAGKVALPHVKDGTSAATTSVSGVPEVQVFHVKKQATRLYSKGQRIKRAATNDSDASTGSLVAIPVGSQIQDNLASAASDPLPGSVNAPGTPSK